MNLISLFAGAGGLDKGFENEGFNIVWANEFDKKIWETYKLNHPNIILETKSISKILNLEIPNNIDGIIGGPPCQSWSIAGSMRGLEDIRGQLFFEYIRILKDKKPLFFVVENVSGLLNKKNIESFNLIKNLFSECGYNISYKLLNAFDYGVAEDRKRVIIVGYRKDLNLIFDFDKLEKSKNKLVLKDVIGDLPIPLPALAKNKTNGYTGEFLNNEYFVGSFSSMFMSRNRIRNWDQPSFTITSIGRHIPLHPSSDKMEFVEKDKWRFTSNNYRRLSIRECARIQSFPDDFNFVYEDLNDAYKMIGNAVPIKLAEVIAKQIKKDLERK